MKGYIMIFKYFLCTSLLFSSSLFAQEKVKLETLILERDSLFWTAYNSCDTSTYRQFFTRDVEFYHDKGGITNGINALISSFQTNLCSKDFRLRREPVPGSVKVFPLKSSNSVYGAILSGQHVFYVLEKGKPERLDGIARFTHLWLLKDGSWKMSRLLSYDHGPAPYINKRKVVKLPAQVLTHLKGTYTSPLTKKLSFQIEGEEIFMEVNAKKFPLFAESETIFFSKERDLTFEFMDERKKLLVRENGQIVEELKLVSE